MIVTRLIGGLGNQMFQYAVARALALRTQTSVRIDRRAFAAYRDHAYALDFFAVELTDATPAQLPRNGIARWLTPLLRDRPRLVRERGLRFDPAIAALTGDLYLDGYWQTEKYFADCAETIRADFRFRHPPSPANAGLLARIAETASVSLHVRRGDYVSNPAAQAVHGTCSPDYYVRALEIIAARTAAPLTVFVFSDDPAWAAAHLRLPAETVVVAGNGPTTAYEDLRLMAACRYHVIANSTFSWWGAWLDPRPDTIVVAPQRWFAAESHDATDVVPSRWLKL